MLYVLLCFAHPTTQTGICCIFAMRFQAQTGQLCLPSFFEMAMHSNKVCVCVTVCVRARVCVCVPVYVCVCALRTLH